jgi:integrase
MIYRRHAARCPHRAEGRRHWSCHCPIWFDAAVSGRRTHKSTGLTDWKEAQVLAQKWLEGDFTQQQPVHPIPKQEPISIEAAWEKFLASLRTRNLSAVTNYKYDLLKRRMLEFSRSRGLQFLCDFDLETLEDFQAEWREGPLSRLKKLERLKAFFRAAVERKWIEQNPTVHLRGPNVKPRPTLPFTGAEMQRILDAITRFPDKNKRTGRANSVRLRAFVLLLRYSGLRIGDVTSLTTDRVAGNKIMLYTQKTGQVVNCVVPDFVAEALANAPRLSEKYFFWTGNSSLHTAIGIWQRTLRRLFKLAGVTNGFAHRFRDTFAVELCWQVFRPRKLRLCLGTAAFRSLKGIIRHGSNLVRSNLRQISRGPGTEIRL